VKVSESLISGEIIEDINDNTGINYKKNNILMDESISECVRDSDTAFTKKIQNYNMSYYHFANKFKNKTDLSKSIICSSISSRVSTESYLN
jgi:hypothetical protein